MQIFLYLSFQLVTKKTMAKGEDSHSEMADVRQRDGINVIFDQNSPASSRSRSPARSSGGGRRSVGSGRHRGRGTHGRRYRSSSSSSSSSRSSSHTRSRSHPRCHRPSSRCRCDNHRRNGRERQPRSRPSSRRYRRSVSRFSQSPPRTHKSGSRSGSSEHSVNLNLDGKMIWSKLGNIHYSICIHCPKRHTLTVLKSTLKTFCVPQIKKNSSKL